MEQKIFMVLQVSKPGTESRKYADFIYSCIKYGVEELYGFLTNGASLYNGMVVEYENCRNEIMKKLNDNKVKISYEHRYILERHDIDNNCGDLMLDLADKLTDGYYGYVVLVDTDNELNSNVEQPPYTNGNVFFEYGVLRAQDKRIALVKQENTRLPWDVSTENAITIPNEILQLIRDNKNNRLSFEEIYNVISGTNRNTKMKIYRMATDILAKLASPSACDTYFSAVLAKKQLERAGFENAGQMLQQVTSLMNALDNKEFLNLSMAKYLGTETEAFEALTEAVKNAKVSIRTTRFANQSIVKRPSERYTPPSQKFMEALFEVTMNNPKLLCKRIVCNNNADKWWDIYQTLKKSNSNMEIYVCKQQYDINFEIVVVDENVTFLHFYQTSVNEHSGDGQVENPKVRKIQSTLRITDSTVGKNFAKIFDRLHHRDENSMSRKLLQVGGDACDIEAEFEGMVLKLDNIDNPERDAKKLLLRKWKEYKSIYDIQSRKGEANNIFSRQDYVNFTYGLYQTNNNSVKGCGFDDDNELKQAYEEIYKDNKKI